MIAGYPAETVTAFGTLALVAATLILAIPTTVLALAAWSQLPLLRGQLKALSDQVEESRSADAKQASLQSEMLRNSEKRHLETNTLRACERYFSDSVIHAAARRFWTATKGGTQYEHNPDIDMHDCLTFLNYLDGIAVGVEEEIFSNQIVYDHMHETIIKVVDEIMPGVLGNQVGYEAIARLREGWRIKEPRYKA